VRTRKARPSIQPKRTEYQGIMFRSRAEGLMAHYLTRIPFWWEYEIDKFYVGSEGSMNLVGECRCDLEVQTILRIDGYAINRQRIRERKKPFALWNIEDDPLHVEYQPSGKRLPGKDFYIPDFMISVPNGRWWILEKKNRDSSDIQKLGKDEREVAYRLMSEGAVYSAKRGCLDIPPEAMLLFYGDASRYDMYRIRNRWQGLGLMTEIEEWEDMFEHDIRTRVKFDRCQVCQHGVVRQDHPDPDWKCDFCEGMNHGVHPIIAKIEVGIQFEKLADDIPMSLLDAMEDGG